MHSRKKPAPVQGLIDNDRKLSQTYQQKNLNKTRSEPQIHNITHATYIIIIIIIKIQETFIPPQIISVVGALFVFNLSILFCLLLLPAKP